MREFSRFRNGEESVQSCSVFNHKAKNKINFHSQKNFLCDMEKHGISMKNIIAEG